MNCKICSQEAPFLFETRVLFKYDVKYFQCNHCEFIQTEEPYWLSEAYAEAITSLDIGLLSRNLVLRELLPKVIDTFFDKRGNFLDYGGGYGVLVRLMRDNGYQFFRQDVYCENLFAKGFDVVDLDSQNEFELLTAFEVFEHLSDPMGELSKMLEYSSNVFFSTEIQPQGVVTPENWWYFIPETGQHVALYSRKALNTLAEINGLKFVSYANYHMFTKLDISNKAFKEAILRKPLAERVVSKILPRRAKHSLLQKDFELIRKGLNNEKL